MGDRLGSLSPRRRRIRWGIGTVSAGCVIAGATSFGTAGGAAADSGPTEGSSYAQLLQVTPHEGSLAVGAVFGEALAGHTDQVARAQSQGMDLGAVGESMRQWNCGSPPNQYVYNAVPEPLQAETGQQGADQGFTQSPNQSNYFSTEYAMADGKPYGQADTTYGGPFADPTNAFVVSGMHSRAWSGVVGGVSEAGATSDIGSVDIAGVVSLRGLHWSVVYPVGGTPVSTFTIGSVTIAGNTLPTSADLSQVQDGINQVLSAVGLVVQLPTTTEAQGVDFISPLQLEVVPSTNRDTVLDKAVTTLQPVYYDMANGLENGFAANGPTQPWAGLAQAETTPPGQQLEAGLCQTDTPITVADITIASFDGGGYFNVALGGVNATSSPLTVGNYNLTEFQPYSIPGTSQVVGATDATPAVAGDTGTPPPATTVAPTGGGGATGAPVPTQKLAARGHGGTPAGGPLLAAGLGGLGLMAFLAEGDRRMMRRAQRTVSVEE